VDYGTFTILLLAALFLFFVSLDIFINGIIEARITNRLVAAGIMSIGMTLAIALIVKMVMQ